MSNSLVLYNLVAFISIYHVLNPSSLWPNAHKFHPDRWLAPDFVKPSHFKYTAFNAGTSFAEE
jgi:cytochrome P450